MENGKNKGEKKVKSTKKKELKKPAEPLPTDEPEEDLNDYGGIPTRNLKKNLGCG